MPVVRGYVPAVTPDLRLLSLGAGVQSTTLALLALDGTLPGLDGAVFADTGWEPAAVYCSPYGCRSGAGV